MHSERHSARWRGRAAAWSAVAAVAAIGAALLWSGVRGRMDARAAFPPVVGRVPVAGLSAPVEIRRDARGIPHVFAAAERDGYLGLGYAHAQDRLAQMLWLVRLARGRTAEVIGRRGLAADRWARLLSIGRLADAQWPRLAPATRRALEAYAAGVNARIARVRSGEEGMPLAVRRLGIPLEDWQPADGLAVLKSYAWGLESSVDTTLLLSDLIQQLGAVAARPFFPQAGRPALPGATVRAHGVPLRDPLRRALGLEGRSVGSSAWVLGGAHSQSGRPLLAGDSHLETTAPPLLYFAHLRAGDLDVAGTTLPGLPVFYSGCNRHVAWASVHARAVVTDLYEETLDPDDPSRYHDGEGWKPLETRVEKVKVAGGEPVEVRVRETRHGPILPGTGDRVLSVAWTGAHIDGPSGIGSLLAAARASDVEEFEEALRTHHEPVLAFVFADTEGAARLKVAGWLPRRALSPELLPLPGRARWYEWREPVPFDALPAAALQNGRGWLVAADNALGGPGHERIEWLWRSGERAQRLDHQLADAVARGPVDLRALAALQGDVGVEHGPELVTTALSLVGRSDLGPEASELAEILEGWGGRAGPDSVGAAAYEAFVTALTRKLLADRMGEALLQRYLASPRSDPERLVLEILGAAATGAPGAWLDADAATRAVRESLSGAWLRLSFRFGANRSRWTWGRLHPLRFRPFGGLEKELGGSADLGPFPYGGTGSTVAAASFDASNPYAVRVASTLRFAVDTGSPDEALVAIAPGESEHPGHPHFDDGIDPWLDGRPALLVMGRLLVEEMSVARLVLEPVR